MTKDAKRGGENEDNNNGRIIPVPSPPLWLDE